MYLCHFIRINSIRNFILIYQIHVFIQLYSIQNGTKMRSKTKNINKKNIQQIKTLQAITFNHLPYRLIQLGCPQQSLKQLLLVEGQNNMSFRSSSALTDCTPTPSNCFFYGTITFDFVTCHNRFFFLLLTLFF